MIDNESSWLYVCSGGIRLGFFLLLLLVLFSNEFYIFFMAAKLTCSVAAIAVGAVRFHLFCQKFFFPTGVHHRRVFIIVVIFVFLVKVKHVSSNLKTNKCKSVDYSVSRADDYSLRKYHEY